MSSETVNLVFSGEDKSIALALLHAVHHQYPRHETQVENLPVNSPLWPIFQRVGYVESFRRIEMRLLL